MSNSVAILIVTYNSEDEIRRCLNSVFQQRDHVDQQVIIVDNQSRDNTASIIRSEFPQVNLVAAQDNLGFAKGCNHASTFADADYILLLNPDTEIKDHAIDNIVDFARENPEYGLYGGRTLRADDTLEPSSCWGEPTLWSMAMFAFGLSTIFKNNAFFDPESLGSWRRDTVREVGVITGCFLLVSREAWAKLGGFDERYFMYGEDVDLSMRARGLGYRPVICPDAELIHEIGASSDTPAHKMVLLFKGKTTLVRSQYKHMRQALALQLLKFGVALRALGSFLNEQSKWGALWKRRSEWISGY